MGINFEEIAAASTELVPEVLPAVRRKAGRPPGPNKPGTPTRGPCRDPLTPQQKKACHEYIACGNKTEAIRRAYGDKYKNPTGFGYQLFNTPKVAAYLQKIQGTQLKKVDLEAESIILELKNLGFSSIKDYLEFSKGKVDLFDSKDISPEALSAISSISMIPGKFGDTVKFTLHDKIKALELLGKNLGIFTEKVEVGVRPIFTFGDNGEGS